MARKTGYHHGDLRQALLRVGLEVLEESGIEGLSLRKIAARVGVSHAAPEHHFPTLRHLINAMAADGFSRFRAAMTEEMAVSPRRDAEQMRAALRGYLAFAMANPHLFRLMFNSNRLDWSDPVLGQAGGEARAVLSEICRPAAIRRNLDTPEGRSAIEHLVWSQIHGYAHLVIDNKFSPPRTKDIDGHGDCIAEPLDLAGLLLPE